jgi:hypothetical protein
MRPDTALEGILRRAMGRAGIAERWKHVCRRRGCGHHEEAQEGELRRCPKCKMKLWPKPQPRPLRFHDLRHTTASLFFMAGADAVAVQKLMRHRDLRMTIGTYGHLSPGYMRGEVDRLRFLPGVPNSDVVVKEERRAFVSGENSTSLGPTLVQGGGADSKPPRPPDEIPVEAWAIASARSTGLEPLDCGFGSPR